MTRDKQLEVAVKALRLVATCGAATELEQELMDIAREALRKMGRKP